MDARILRDSAVSNGDLLLSVRLEGICHFGNAKSLAIGSRLPKILRGGETGLGVDNTFLSLCQRLFRFGVLDASVLQLLLGRFHI